jgi:hypothetical protein
MIRKVIIPMFIGCASALFPTVTFAVTIVHEINYPLTNTDWGSIQLNIPQYDPTSYENQPLKSVFVEAITDVSGTYILEKKGLSNINYGSVSNTIETNLEVTGPSNSLNLTPSTLDSVGSGTLNSLNPILIKTINQTGSDSETLASNFLGLYTGTGNVTFEATAQSLVNISKSGNPYLETADIQASLLIRVTYEYEPSEPLEIPEPSFKVGLFSIAFCGVAMLVINQQKKYF